MCVCERRIYNIFVFLKTRKVCRKKRETCSNSLQVPIKGQALSVIRRKKKIKIKKYFFFSL